VTTIEFLASDRKPADVVRDYYQNVEEAMRPVIGRGGRMLAADRMALALARKTKRRRPPFWAMTPAEQEAKRRRP